MRGPIPKINRDDPDVGSPIIAQYRISVRLRFEGDPSPGLVWAAVVAKAPTEDPLKDAFQLYFARKRVNPDTMMSESGDWKYSISKDGVFFNGKALAKFIREKAANVVVDGCDALVEVDTLYFIQKRSGVSVVPRCWGHWGKVLSDGVKICTISDTGSCPYLEECKMETVGELPKQEEPPVEKDTESDFLERLQDKIRNTWGE